MRRFNNSVWLIIGVLGLLLSGCKKKLPPQPVPPAPIVLPPKETPKEPRLPPAPKIETPTPEQPPVHVEVVTPPPKAPAPETPKRKARSNRKAPPAQEVKTAEAPKVETPKVEAAEEAKPAP